MSVFNSLGSNYGFPFVLRALLSKGSDKDSKNLRLILEKEYGGKAILLQKGRQAITLAFQSLNLPKGSLVGVNGFTCFAVFQAIKEAGHKPIYFDVEKRALNFSTETVKSKKLKNLKVLIVQNTLGIPCDIDGIKNFCSENRILLIEDLAHCAGGSYLNGKQMGTIGDFIVLSFGQDKIIDSVSGGALIIRNTNYANRIIEENLSSVTFVTQIKDKFYPLFSFLVRKTYSFGLGKGLHFLFRVLHFLSQSVSSGQAEPHKLTIWQANLAKECIKNLNQNIDHRRKISSVYSKKLPQKIVSSDFVRSLDFSTNLRFPIFVKNRKSLISYLKQKGIYVSDIWYDAPVAPKKYLQLTDYREKTCPNAEKVSREILNLPTHINVSEENAEFISESINLWLKSQ